MKKTIIIQLLILFIAASASSVLADDPECSGMPSSGGDTWVIENDCQYTGTFNDVLPGPLQVGSETNNVTVTIANDAILNVDLTQHNLTVKGGSTLVIEEGIPATGTISGKDSSDNPIEIDITAKVINRYLRPYSLKIHLEHDDSITPGSEEIIYSSATGLTVKIKDGESTAGDIAAAIESYGYIDTVVVITGNSSSSWVLCTEADCSPYDNTVLTGENAGTVIHCPAVPDPTAIIPLNDKARFLLDSIPYISDMEDEQIDIGEEDNVISGIHFGSNINGAKVELVENANYTGTMVVQSIDSWADDSIQFDSVQGSLSESIVYLFVTNDLGERSSAYVVDLGGAHSSLVPEPSFSFVAMGDSRRNDNQNCVMEDFELMMNAIANLEEEDGIKPAFVINAGDLVYGSLKCQYTAFYNYISDYMQSSGLPFFSLPGNHEFYTSGNKNGFLNYETYVDDNADSDFDYDFSYGNSRFFVFNNAQHQNPKCSRESFWYCFHDSQINAQSTLGQVTPDPDVNLFTFSHLPISRPEGKTSRGGLLLDGYRDFHNLTVDKGVRVHFCGHMHDYFRSSGSDLCDDVCTHDPGGLFEIVTGGGGANSGSGTGESPTHYNGHHWLLVTVTESHSIYINMYIKGVGNNARAQEYDFSIPADDVSPTIIAASPSGTGVPVDTKIVATFSEAMFSATTTTDNITVSYEDEGVTKYVAGSIHYVGRGITTGEGTTIEFTPDINLSGDTVYTVTISENVQDLYGKNSLDPLSPYKTWTFETSPSL